MSLRIFTPIVKPILYACNSAIVFKKHNFKNTLTTNDIAFWIKRVSIKLTITTFC